MLIDRQTNMNLKNIKINGRYIIQDGKLVLFNSGSGISFKMKGKSFTVTIGSKTWPCYYYFIIDRDYKNKVKLSTPCNPVCCFSFNDEKEHMVDIVKANEANDSLLFIEDLEIDGKLLEYDHQYDKKVIVYGDSTIAGYGILSHDEASIDTSDGVRDFAYHALYELNYDMDIFCASGYGLSFSAYTTPKTIGIYDYIKKVSVNSDFSWERQNKHDILIISLGCNDASYISEQPNNKEEYAKMFIKRYQGLIDSEIKLNSDIKILMIYGTLKEQQAYYLVEQAYESLKPLYKNLYIHKFDGDNTAASNHAFITAHDRMAEELKAVLKSLLK